MDVWSAIRTSDLDSNSQDTAFASIANINSLYRAVRNLLGLDDV
jgi:hypothetical protein